MVHSSQYSMACVAKNVVYTILCGVGAYKISLVFLVMGFLSLNGPLPYNYKCVLSTSLNKAFPFFSHQ